MSYDRRAYDDADTTGQMTLDAAACEQRLPLRATRSRRLHLRPEDVVRPAPRLDYDATGREVVKRDIEVSQAAAHLAAQLHLHLD